MHHKSGVLGPTRRGSWKCIVVKRTITKWNPTLTRLTTRLTAYYMYQNLSLHVLANIGHPHGTICTSRHPWCMDCSSEDGHDWPKHVATFPPPPPFHDKVSLSKEHQTYTQMEWNDIRPQTAQFYNKRISTDPILVTWQSTVNEPHEDGL